MVEYAVKLASTHSHKVSKVTRIWNLILQALDLDLSSFEGTTTGLAGWELVTKTLGKVFIHTDIIFAEKMKNNSLL